MDDKDYLRNLFATHAEVIQLAAPNAIDSLTQASELIVQCLLAGGKLIGCSDASATNLVQYFCTLLLSRCERQRPGLPAISLTDNPGVLMAIQDEFGPEQVYARQIRTLGQAGDVLMAMCNAPSRRRMGGAIEAAHERELPIVALGLPQDVVLEKNLNADDILIPLPETHQSRNQGLSLVYLHALCELIDRQLLGE